MKKIISKDYAVVAILFILILIPFIPILFLGKTFIDTGMIYSDLTAGYYSLFSWGEKLIAVGKFPYWTNLTGNGFPAFSEPGFGILYPPNRLLHAFLPMTAVFNLNFFLHFLLAAISTYFFSRISLKLSKPASILAAITYTFSGYFFARLSYMSSIFIISYFPLILFLTERIVSKQKFYLMFILAFIFAFELLAGYPEFFYYNFVLSFLFLIFLILSGGEDLSGKKFGIPRKILPVIFIFCAFFLSVLISSVQILSAYELTKQSVRSSGLSYEAAASTIWPIKTLVLFVNPHAYDSVQLEDEYHPSNKTTYSIPAVYEYIGILSLILGFIAIFFQFRKRFVFIFTFLLAFVFVWAQGRFSQLFAILWTIVPGIQFFRFPQKILFALELFLAILAGFGLDFLIKKFFNKSISKAIIFSFITITIVYVDLFFNNVRRQPTVPADFWINKTPEAVEFLNKNLDKVNYQIYTHGTNNISARTTKDPILQKDFQNLLPPIFNLMYQIPANRGQFSLMITRQEDFNGFADFNPETRVFTIEPLFKRKLDLQGVKYLLSDVEFDNPEFTLVEKIPFSKTVDHLVFLQGGGTVKIKVDGTHIYRNDDAYPRINFVTNVIDASKKDQLGILNTIISEEFNPRREVVLEEPVEFTNAAAKSNFKVNKYEETKTEINVNSDKPGFLVITRTFYPGWTASVDGQKTKIYRANYNFQAVQVPAGEHLIKFQFEPTYWRLGLLISGIGIGITLLGLIFTAIKRL